MNLHYQFWVDYYKGLENSQELSKDDTIENKNRALVDSTWEDSGKAIPAFGGMQTLTFRVMYPGLLMGLGYDHSAEPAEDAPKIALGMSLDYTTGLPYIPGSEVKGVLRSAFIRCRDFINCYMSQGEKEFSQLSDEEIHALELDIFGHTHPYDPNYALSQGVEEGRGKDVFFDAFPVRADKNRHLIRLETNTPHIPADPAYKGLTAINPITLLKVMPGVEFLFRFRLTDSVIKDGRITVTARQKLKLFEAVIADFGMGAKTNVGFGLLEKAEESFSGNYLSRDGKQSSGHVNANETSRSSDRSERKTNSPSGAYTFDAVITSVERNTVHFKDSKGIDRYTFRDKLAEGIKWENLAKGTKCRFELRFVAGSGENKKPEYRIIKII